MNRFESVNENFPSVQSKEVEEERGLRERERERESGEEGGKRIRRKRSNNFGKEE